MSVLSSVWYITGVTLILFISGCPKPIERTNTPAPTSTESITDASQQSLELPKEVDKEVETSASGGNHPMNQPASDKSDPLVTSEYIYSPYDGYAYGYKLASDCWASSGVDGLGAGVSEKEQLEFCSHLGSGNQLTYELPKHTLVHVVSEVTEDHPEVITVTVSESQTILDMNGNEIKGEGKKLYVFTDDVVRANTFKNSQERAAEEAREEAIAQAVINKPFEPGQPDPPRFPRK